MKIGEIFVVLFGTLIAILSLIFDISPNFVFCVNLLFCFIICFKAKLSLFTLKEMLLMYVLLAVAYQFNTGESYGILQYYGKQLYFSQMNLIILVYNVIFYLFLIKTNVLELEYKKLTQKINYSNICNLIFAIGAIVFTIIAFPRFGYVSNTAERFNSLLPGHAWNHVAIICLVLIMPSVKKSKLSMFSIIFCTIWFLVNGERVDIIGILFCLIFYLFLNKMKDNNSKKQFRNYLKTGGLILVLVFAMIVVGIKKTDTGKIEISYVIKNIFVQPTACDVGYTFHASIRYINDNGKLYGKTYWNYIRQIIPFISGSKSASSILISQYRSPGGIFLLSEPYMNFGIIGVILFEIIELLILYLILKNDYDYCFYLYLFLMSTLFRTSWYGLEYIEMGIIYILPILYCIMHFLKKKWGAYEKV